MESDDDANASSPSPSEASLFANIHTEIKAMRSDVKNELHSFRSTLREDVKKELTELWDEINQALGDIGGDLKNPTTRVEETEQRVAELEELKLEDSLWQMQQKEETIQTKMRDLEARSRQNNICIYGIPEGEEENNTTEVRTGHPRRARPENTAPPQRSGSATTTGSSATFHNNYLSGV